ncbi:hypothetical protein Sjap_018517 [Stephania japonica]|uniref:Uncharacterized protein n=1 Tax=Stephania japonica TaxID=461633 RepID=A0AAP0I886_9MAGN
MSVEVAMWAWCLVLGNSSLSRYSSSYLSTEFFKVLNREYVQSFALPTELFHPLSMRHL